MDNLASISEQKRAETVIREPHLCQIAESMVSKENDDKIRDSVRFHKRVFSIGFGIFDNKRSPHNNRFGIESLERRDLQWFANERSHETIIVKRLWTRIRDRR